MFQLEHMVGGADGAHYITVMDRRAVKSDIAGEQDCAPTLPRRQGARWVKHNIEEVGQLEYSLPQLASSGVAEPAQCAQRGHRAPDGEYREAEPVHRQRHRLRQSLGQRLTA